jgi:hypothetical protein
MVTTKKDYIHAMKNKYPKRRISDENRDIRQKNGVVKSGNLCMTNIESKQPKEVKE